MNDQQMAHEVDDLDAEEQALVDAMDRPTSSALAVIERAQLDSQIATARQFPRSVHAAIKLLTTTVVIDQETAQECIYTLPRGKKPIIGPSIRFAEALKQAWGNCISESEPTLVDKEGGWVHARGVFRDLQTNAETRKTTKRRITDSRGRVYSDDMIIMTSNAACAIAERNAILAGVPKGVWRRAYTDVLQLCQGNIETFTESRDRVIKEFAKYGVTAEMILGSLELKGVDDLTLEHIPVMRGMYSALKNGEETPETLFDPRQGRPFQAVKDPLNDAPAGEREPAREKPAADQEKPAAQETAQDGRGEAEQAPPPAKPKPAAKAVPAAATAKAGPTAAKPAPAAAGPKTVEEYEAHARAWIVGATSRSRIEDTWKLERPMRDEIGANAPDPTAWQNMLDTLGALRRERVQEIAEANR